MIGWMNYAVSLDKPKGGSMDNKFTEDDLDACWDYYKEYLIDILNGDYAVEAAREDLASLIGSKYDRRVVNNQ